MRDSIEHELYERNNADDVAQVSLNFTTSSSSRHGVEVMSYCHHILLFYKEDNLFGLDRTDYPNRLDFGLRLRIRLSPNFRLAE